MTGKKKWIAGLSVLVSGFLVVLLLNRMDTERAGLVLAKADLRWLMAAAFLNCMIPIFCVMRWLGVLKAQEGNHLGFRHALRAVLMANVLNSVLPSKAGDVAKAFYLKNHGGIVVGLGTVVLERAVDLSMLGLMGIIGYFISGAFWGLVSGGLLLGGIFSFAVSATFFPIEKLPLPEKYRQKLVSLLDVLKRWIRKPFAVLQTVIASFCTWALAGLSVCFLTCAFHRPVWGYSFGVFPLAVLAGLIPLTVSGIGTRDSAFIALLSSQMPVEEATFVGLGYTILAYWLISLISLPVVVFEIWAFWKNSLRLEEKQDAF